MADSRDFFELIKEIRNLANQVKRLADAKEYEIKMAEKKPVTETDSPNAKAFK